MSTDPIGVAFGRDDATVAARTLQIAAEPSNELTGIATAIERVEALLAACGPGPDGADAIERIADIAFVLHERDVEASLCDALDAAVRELANAGAAKQVNVQHVRQAAELLRELSHRVADMIALPQVSPPAANDPVTSEPVPNEPAAAPAEELASSEDTLNGDIPREGLFAAELLEDDEFARAVAELAASLPALTEPAEAFAVTLREPADRAADEPVLIPEPSDRIAEAQHEPADLAGDESALAPEREQAFTETLQEPADLAAEESALAAVLQEALAETQPDEPAVAAEQRPLVTDYASVIEITPADQLPVADEVSGQLARDNSADDAVHAAEAPAEVPENEAISIAAPLNEGAPSETLSDSLSEDAGATAAPPPDLPGYSADHVLASEHATADAPIEALPPPAPEETPAHEIANSPDDRPVSASNAELELPPLDEAPSPPADAAYGVAAEQPLDQITARSNGGDGPAQIANEPKPHGIDNMIAEAAAEVSEAPPSRVSESSQSLLPELALVDPQDDPGDLFEPLAGEAPTITTANLGEPQSASEISAPGAATPAPPATAGTDPLAAMRALNAEELLALFT